MAAGERGGSESGFTRRHVLLVAGSAGASALIARTVLRGADEKPRVSPTAGPSEPGAPVAGPGPSASGRAAWSDPATWGGRVPGEHDVVTVDGPVLLDVDARVAGVTIVGGGELVFDGTQSRTLETTGNVVVGGRLEMAPVSAAVVHRLVFAGIDEARFVGGGMDVVEADVGLWVIGEGVLHTAGAPKLAWARAEGAVVRGASQIRLAENPTGWRVGDEIAVAPTLAPDVENHWDAYDTAAIVAIDGRLVTLSEPTAFEHPAVSVGNGVVQAAEVLNLSRNVAIEGTPSGRAHTFLLATRAQTIRYTSLRHMGPRKGAGEDEFIPGRYAIHFHMAGEGSRGSVVEGAVGRECGSHTFVTHLSHGVTWKDCISHDTVEAAYWWDPEDKETGIPAAESNDVVYERCVASRIRADEKRFRMAAFFLGAGRGNAARGCVAVGIERSGITWPSKSQGVWTFEDCVSHNNKDAGIFVWQNTDRSHVITRFRCFHNGSYGVEHGAYKNGYHYVGGLLYGNGLGSISIKALSRAPDPTLRFADVACDAAGLSDYNVVVPDHVLPSDTPAQFVGCSFRGHRAAAFGFLGEGANGHRYDLIDNSYEGNEFWLASGIPADSVIRVQDATRGSLELVRNDMEGSANPQWNASVRPVLPFAPSS